MILSKEDVKYISQNINPEETNYVMGVSTILNDVGNEYKSRYEDTPVEQKPSEEKINQEAMVTTEDILLLNKLIGYSNKFINATYACKTEQYKYRIQDYQWRLKDTIEKSMRIMSLKYGQDFNIVYNIEIPGSNDPLVLINDIKEMLFNYVAKAEMSDNAEDWCLHKIMQEALQATCESIYEFRLTKG